MGALPSILPPTSPASLFFTAISSNIWTTDSKHFSLPDHAEIGENERFEQSCDLKCYPGLSHDAVSPR
jgi:hypothetical protein